MELDELKQLLETAELELTEARDEYIETKKVWEDKNQTVRDLRLEYNQKSGNLENMEWLINNPEQPGQYKALEKKITELYGGIYSGIHPCGYTHNGDYIPIQQSFDLRLRNYDGDVSFRENIEHFMENFLIYLNPFEEISSRRDDSIPEVSVVGFQYQSVESGLSYIGYDPTEDCWFHYKMTFGMVDADKKFKTLTQALDYIYDRIH